MTNLAANETKAEAADQFRGLTGGRTLAILGAYFFLQTVLRVLVSDTAELDESAQVLAAQTWQWGYGSDGPLYTWLQILSFRLFGTNILGLSVLKNALLFAIGALTWRAAFDLSRDQTFAAVAAFSLLLFPQITWESQRDLTHSVLATALAAGTFVVAVRLYQSPTLANYVWLGACLGLGTLSKYSYAVFAVALGLAALSVPNLRRLILNWRFLVSLGVFALLAGFYFRWVMFSPDLAFRKAHEVVQKNEGLWLSTRLRGLFSVVECAFMLGAVLGVAYGTAFWKTPRENASAIALPAGPWIRRTLWIVGAICCLVVLATGIKLKDRWFQPLVFLIAIGAVLAVRERLTTRTARRVLAWSAVAGIAALAMLPTIPLAASFSGRPTRLNAPYAALSEQLRKALPDRALIVGSTRWVAGNLKLWFPERAALAPESVYVPMDAEAPWMVVWDATKSVQPPPALAEMVLNFKGISLPSLESTYIEAPSRYAPRKSMKLGYVILPSARQR